MLTESEIITRLHTVVGMVGDFPSVISGLFIGIEISRQNTAWAIALSDAMANRPLANDVIEELLIAIPLDELS